MDHPLPKGRTDRLHAMQILIVLDARGQLGRVCLPVGVARNLQPPAGGCHAPSGRTGPSGAV